MAAGLEDRGIRRSAGRRGASLCASASVRPWMAIGSHDRTPIGGNASNRLKSVSSSIDKTDDPSKIDDMSTLTRKQREIQEREQRILAVARTALLEQGYLGLSMDAIAAHLEYSKGTIYNHFPCKEEIIIALALETNDKRLGMFERAAAWPGLPREPDGRRRGRSRAVRAAVSGSLSCGTTGAIDVDLGEDVERTP